MSGAENLNDFDVRRTARRTLCWKCRDGRTRAHHRLCSKRGGKVERLRAAWAAEVMASARREPSPGRLSGAMLAQARLYGSLWRQHDAETEAMSREMSPLTASTDGLEQLAALYGVAR